MRLSRRLWDTIQRVALQKALLMEKQKLSENFLRLIPTDPLYVPPSVAQDQVRHLFASFVQGEDIRANVTEEVAFVDPGSNLERILCPNCGAVLADEWWGQAMDQAYAEMRFQALDVVVPCCETHCSLNDLYYDWPAGFARFLLEARSPANDLAEEDLILIESLLGCQVRRIWAHY